MWARIIEFSLACWIAMSRFIFSYREDETFLMANDLIIGALIAIFALTSLYPRINKMHLFNLAVAGWLFILSYTYPDTPFPPAIQNYIVLGMLLVIFAIIPTDATESSHEWRRKEQKDA